MLQPPLPLPHGRHRTNAAVARKRIENFPELSKPKKVCLIRLQTGSSEDAKRDVRRKLSDEGCGEADAAADDDEEAEGRRAPGAHLLSGERPDV